MSAVPVSVSVPSLGGGASSAPSSTSSSPSHRNGPGLYEFLIEAELQQYYGGIKNELKIQNVAQLKYVTEEDLNQIGMSKPEMRRLKKFFHKHFPQNYLSKFKKMILPRREEHGRPVLILPDERVERPPIRVPNKHIIPAETIIVNKELGTGEFGVVQQGVWSNDGERIQVAIKCLSRERMQNNPIEFLKEAAIMHANDHEHIVRLYGVVLDTSSLMLVTELAPLRSLLECLKEPSLRSSFPVLTLCDFAIQICDGMQYLEFKRLIHRDLAARNILVFSKNKVKISDFGLSRALGVGKDYYQTNFKVNLKLPIAWCAPECITYLRFTSSSDVWAYGVTLWEMFSYGFQPWAALTGHQILEAIDDPNYQRLELPECCPRDYYSVMHKCWNHDPNKRPKFSELMMILPECKPEQVQAVQDYVDDPTMKVKREPLHYRMEDIITVLDKNPLPNVSNCWKGILSNCRTGHFNPAFTVAYLGANLPSTKSEFTRGDGKNTYSSKRRLRSDMISSPQGDLKHTGHVGLDGAYFGDISFLGGNSSSVQYPPLPRQVVSPYKPHEDYGGQHHTQQQQQQGGALHTRNPSTTSDRAPLLASKHTAKPNNNACADNDEEVLAGGAAGKGGRFFMHHEYHEISDEENGVESPRFEKSFDFGPSLVDEMDAMFKSLGGSCKVPSSPAPALPSTSAPVEEPRDLAHNVRNELREMAARVTGGKKKQALVVKPISASDQRTLESAIAMANELACRSMQELEGGSETSPPPESPHTPASPNKRKFSFKFAAGGAGRSSPKSERRNFAEEAASIPDIQSTLTEEARAAYNSLVEAPAFSDNSHTHDSSSYEVPCNPLRMLRSGVAVRPRVRGNKQRHTLERQHTVPAPSSDWTRTSTRSLPRARTNHPLPPPPLNRRYYCYRRPEVAPPIPPPPTGSEQSEDSSEDGGHQLPQYMETSSGKKNPIPLPPRDRKPQLTNKPRHQRKHPLIIPVEGFTRNIARMGSDLKIAAGEAESLSVAPPQPLSPTTQLSDTSSSEGGQIPGYVNNQTPYVSAIRQCMVDDSYENQIASEFAALDNIPEEDPISPSPVQQQQQQQQQTPPLAVPEGDDDDDALLRNGDHVSCEDLLDFACDGPNARRTRGPAHGPQSDEVRIMGKVLGKGVSSDDCVSALDATTWDVHQAIKVARLQSLLGERRPQVGVARVALLQCRWDVVRAAEWVMAEQDETDTTEV